MKKLIFAFWVLLISGNFLYAQSNMRVGLSGTLQGSQLGIAVPMWLGDNFVLAPGLDLRYAETIGTDYTIGLALRHYLKVESLAPYVGMKLGAAIFSPSSEQNVDKKTYTDIIGGLAFGAEYFFSSHFSVAVEAQGNFTRSHENSMRFGNPGGLNFNTATAVTATVYF